MDNAIIESYHHTAWDSANLPSTKFAHFGDFWKRFKKSRSKPAIFLLIISRLLTVIYVFQGYSKPCLNLVFPQSSCVHGPNLHTTISSGKDPWNAKNTYLFLIVSQLLTVLYGLRYSKHVWTCFPRKAHVSLHDNIIWHAVLNKNRVESLRIAQCQTRIRQGDSLSCDLFKILLEKYLRDAEGIRTLRS